MKLKFAVSGAAGRMGRMLVNVVSQDPDCQLVSAVEAQGHPQMGEDSGEVAGIGPIGVPINFDIEGDPDVLLDFSTPEASMHRAQECAGQDIAVVIGTTGFSDEQVEQLRSATASVIPLLVAPNMSVGVNLMFELAAQAAEAVGEDWDIEIVEAHHNQKKDAPSGTANGLAEVICDTLNWDQASVLCHGRAGAVGKRPHKQIGVHAIRGGDIIGTHTVTFAGEGQTIEITHRAGSRDIFARGAVRAGKFLCGKPAGFYTMKDVLRKSSGE